MKIMLIASVFLTDLFAKSVDRYQTVSNTYGYGSLKLKRKRVELTALASGV